jgi:hypothetical protein
MAKREQRWPIWKIVAVLAGTVLGAAGFFVASRFIGRASSAGQNEPPLNQGTAMDFTMSNMLMLFGAICVAMSLICVGWLVVRYYQSIPAWKKRAKLPPHRRK